MKKIVSMSLAAALALSIVPSAFAKESVNENLHGQVEVKIDLEKNKDKTIEVKVNETKQENVKKAVKTKKELIELRQKLKASAEINAEWKAQYEALVADLQLQKELTTALEVQLELLEKLQINTKEQFEKLGELYEQAGQTELKAFVNGKQPEYDVAPFIEKGRALVPIRAISAALKADVVWQAETRSVVITRGEQSITLYVDKKEALVNGKTISLEASPVLKKGRLFLPLRFISEQLKAEVTWQAEGKIVIIEDEETATQPETTESTTTTEQPTTTVQPPAAEQTTSTSTTTSTTTSTSTN